MRLAMATAFLLASLSACNGPETFIWNQRLTVTVDTPDGPVTASSVIEVRVTYNESGGGLARDVQFQARHSGEAVAVEVAPEQYLFVPLRAPSAWPIEADPERFSDVEFPDYLPMIIEQTEPFQMCGENQFCPDMLALVERELYGLREVTPETIADVFGEGFAISSVILEVTDSQITTGAIQQALQWTCTDFDPDRPGIRPSLRIRSDGFRGWNSVPYLEFTTERFCNQGNE